MTRLPSTATVDDVVLHLERDGYAIVEGALDPATLRATRDDVLRLLQETPTGRNRFEGFQTQRVYALFARTRMFDAPATHPLVLGVLDRVLGQYQLSAPQAIQIGPGEAAQPLHRDDVVYPVPHPHAEFVVNTMWALDDFTEANGATNVVPGSHRWPEGRTPGEGDAVERAVMPAGSLMFFLGSVYHGGGANTTDRPRLGVILEYVCSWLRQQENQYLAVPREVVRTLPVRLQELLGYNLFNNLVGVVDARHPLKALHGE